MRTLLTIAFFIGSFIIVSAQDDRFNGMGYVIAGSEIVGPVQVRQNVGGSISIGKWPKATFFIFDEYTAVLDTDRNVLFKGGMPSTGTPGDKFMAEKEKLINATPVPPQPQEEVVAETQSNSADKPKRKKKKERTKKVKDKEATTQPQEEVVAETQTDTQDKPKKKKKRDREVSDNQSISQPLSSIDNSLTTSDSLGDYPALRDRFGLGAAAVNYQVGTSNSLAYGFTVNRTFPFRNRFRFGASADVVVYHDYIFKQTITPMMGEGSEYMDDYPQYQEPYKVPEGFAGAVQLRPFAGVDFGCFRGGFQPVFVFTYHSIWGTNTDLFPLGVLVGFLSGPVQVDLFAAMKLKNSMYYPRMRMFGAAVTFGNRSANRKRNVNRQF